MNFEKLLFKKISLWVFLLFTIFFIIITIWFANLTLRSTTAREIALIPDRIKIIFSDFEKDFLVGANASNINGLKLIYYL